MTVIALNLVVTVIGLLMYAFSANPKLSDVGRIMFAAGLLALLLGSGGALTTVLPR